jgi:gliding-associated putative ABC transporter substrate-binding component GldG
MITKKKIQTSIILIAGILILVNIISDRLFLRLDFTADQRYSLSDATKDILSNLNDPVTVKAYFSEDLPPDIGKVKQDFKDLLIEYGNYSGGQIVYEFVNPNENEQTEMEAQQSGIRPVMINVRERDQTKQQRAYLGALVEMGDQKDVIPFIQPGSAMEYALSTSIKKLSVKNKPKIAFLVGDGEPSLASMPQLMQQLEVLYTVDTVTIDASGNLPTDFNTLAIVAPKDTVNPIVFQALDRFMQRGGKIVLGLNAVNGNMSNAQGEVLHTGFEDWLKAKGVQVEPDFVVDINCASVSVRQQQGPFVINTPMSFPYLPIINNFSDHAITGGLEQVIFPFVSSIKIVPPDTSVKITILATSSDKSGVKNAPTYFDINKKWGETDFTLSKIPVAVAIEGQIANGSNGQMVVFGDGDFVVNGEGQNAQKLQPDNVNLFSNAIDWLSDDTGLISLRTKGVTARPIDPNLEDSTKAFIKYLNFLLPIILIIGYGIYRFQLKRKLQNKLKSIDYA